MAIVKPSLLAAILCSLTNGGSVEGGVTTGVRHLLSNAVDGVVGYSVVDKEENDADVHARVAPKLRAPSSPEKHHRRLAPETIEQDILDRVEQGFCLKQPDGASDDSDYQKYGFISSCEIYDEVVCRKVPALLPGHGCDGIDNNCDADLTPDECAEDEFPPTIDFSNAHEFCGNDKHIFPTPDAAKACLTKQVMTTDDCYPVSTMVGDAVETSSSAKCGTTYAFSVGASEDICNKTSSGSFMVLVDSNIDPTQSACEFSKGPDVAPELNVIQAKENCGRNTFFSSKENALECVEHYSTAKDECRPVDVTYVDTDVTGTSEALSNCTKTVKVTVTANIKGCEGLSTSKDVLVLVDKNVEDPKCDFSKGPDTPPELDVLKAIELCSRNTFFSDDKNAEECVEKYTTAKDECRPVKIKSKTTEVTGTAEALSNCAKTVKVTMTAKVKGCDDLITSKDVFVLVDENVDHPKCDFSKGPDVPPELNVIQAKENCGRNTFFSSTENALECVEHYSTAKDECRPVDVAYVETDVTGTAEALSNCAKTVKVTVTANIKGCEELSTSKDVLVLVDENVEDPKCDFSRGPDIPPELDVLKAIELCGRNTFFSADVNAEECVKKHTTAKDECRPVEIESMLTDVTGTPEALSICTKTVKVTMTAKVKGCDGLSTSKDVLTLVDENVADPRCDFNQGPDVKPALDVTRAEEFCEYKIFDTIDAGEACVLDKSTAEDVAGSCRPIVTQVSSELGEGVCEYDVTVKANIKDCTDGDLETVSDPIVVVVDNDPPVVQCEIAVQDLTGNGAGVFRDLGFTFTAVDECTSTKDLAVTIEVLSNEVVTTGDEMVVISEPDNVTKTPTILAEDYTCKTGANGKCVISSTKKSRLYMVRVTAIDKGGNVGVGECKTIVGNQDFDDTDPRFLVVKLDNIGGVEEALPWEPSPKNNGSGNTPPNPTPQKPASAPSPPVVKTKDPTNAPTKAPTPVPTNTPIEAEKTTTAEAEKTNPALTIVGNNGNPKNVFPLQVCQGDCDGDNECDTGLKCMQRDRNEAVPGCEGEGKRGTDYCYIVNTPTEAEETITAEAGKTTTVLTKVGDNGEPSNVFPLQVCEGDCDSDNECDKGLKCMQRSGTEAVPGCEGEGERGKDYCYSDSE